ncbi:MAG TPA: hypothetical protein VLY46_06880 [Usitatibacter sp.]|nr:hypothetical protein [Usitatibacter sp.]
MPLKARARRKRRPSPSNDAVRARTALASSPVPAAPLIPSGGTSCVPVVMQRKGRQLR